MPRYNIFARTCDLNIVLWVGRYTVPHFYGLLDFTCGFAGVNINFVKQKDDTIKSFT